MFRYFFEAKAPRFFVLEYLTNWLNDTVMSTKITMPALAAFGVTALSGERNHHAFKLERVSK